MSRATLKCVRETRENVTCEGVLFTVRLDHSANPVVVWLGLVSRVVRSSWSHGAFVHLCLHSHRKRRKSRKKTQKCLKSLFFQFSICKIQVFVPIGEKGQKTWKQEDEQQKKETKPRKVIVISFSIAFKITLQNHFSLSLFRMTSQNHFFSIFIL